MIKQKKKLIFWDWNGTLLDDVHICINIINLMLQKRSLPLIDLQEYRDAFTFPVKEYYEKLGFDFEAESFDISANEFIDLYSKHLYNADLHENVYETLEYFKDMGFEQYILSAMEHNMLNDIIRSKGIESFFNEIAGIKDIYANSKLYIVNKLMDKLNVNSGNIVFVGDTLHDYEIADYFGFHSVLLTHGHQSKERLDSSGAIIRDDFSNFREVIISIFE